MPFSTVFDTGLHADCVRFIPKEERNVAVFSCYELEESSKKRLGKLMLVEALENDEVKVLESVEGLPGVFEFSFFRDESNVLVTALAEGPPKFFKYSESCALEEIAVAFCGDGDEASSSMTLAVAGESTSFLTCDNNGGLREWSLRGGGLEGVRKWDLAHEAEIWYVSQDHWDPNIFYTGADDACMKLWDRRRDDQSPIASNKRSHGAGVCSVVSSPFEEFKVASGSYDGNVRIWDRRMLAKGPCAIIDCGSGVWRVIWHPEDGNKLGVAAMRAGFHLIDLTSGQGQIYRSEGVDYDAVAYGIDWKSDSCIASCSFYNNQGQFWG